jgi:hypothetical protein
MDGHASHITVEVAVKAKKTLDWMLLLCLHTHHMPWNLFMCFASKVLQ